MDIKYNEGKKKFLEKKWTQALEIFKDVNRQDKGYKFVEEYINICNQEMEDSHQ